MNSMPAITRCLPRRPRSRYLSRNPPAMESAESLEQHGRTRSRWSRLERRVVKVPVLAQPDDRAARRTSDDRLQACAGCLGRCTGKRQGHRGRRLRTESEKIQGEVFTAADVTRWAAP